MKSKTASRQNAPQRLLPAERTIQRIAGLPTKVDTGLIDRESGLHREIHEGIRDRLGRNAKGNSGVLSSSRRERASDEEQGRTRFDRSKKPHALRSLKPGGI